MPTLQLLGTLIPLSLCSGINLYATVLMIGLSVRFGWATGVPEGLYPLGSWPVLALAGIFYLLEFLADKVPFIDNIWDLIHTAIRPLGAALPSFAAVASVSFPMGARPAFAWFPMLLPPMKTSPTPLSVWSRTLGHLD